MNEQRVQPMPTYPKPKLLRIIGCEFVKLIKRRLAWPVSKLTTPVSVSHRTHYILKLVSYAIAKESEITIMCS